MLQHGCVTGRANTIEYNTGNDHIVTKVQEPRDEGRHGVGCRLGINHQHYRHAKHTGYLGRRAGITVVTVEETHHAFNHSHVGIMAVVVI